MALTILLRSSWQTHNIGDIAHTPGMLRLLEQHLPEASVILWPSQIDRGVEPMLRRRFPQLRIVGEANCDLESAMAEADLFLHGSGPDWVARADTERWRTETGKPYGAFGVTLGNVIGATDSKPRLSDELRKTIEGAAFVFTRETRSFKFLRESGIVGPELGFAPDATFAVDVRDDAAAERFLSESALEPERFACFVPRLRITPYWEIYPETTMSPDEIARRQAVNDQHADGDHAKLRQAIIAYVRETGNKALVCPEMTYQVGIIRPLVYDPLPPDVKARVVPMDRYWLTDEAASVYRQAQAVVSMECHSPILANANGRPSIYLRQPTDTWKGQMYPDLGLGAWALDIDAVSGTQIAAALRAIYADYPAALTRARAASNKAAERFGQAIAIIRSL